MTVVTVITLKLIMVTVMKFLMFIRCSRRQKWVTVPGVARLPVFPVVLGAFSVFTRIIVLTVKGKLLIFAATLSRWAS